MEVEPTTEHPTPTPPASSTTPEAPTAATAHRARTYEDDMSRAMNTTDAKVVQEMLATARAREAAQIDFTKSSHQRRWYAFFSTFFVILALAGFGYATYHYYTLTVPVEENFSVGVFPSTAPVVIADTDIRQTIAQVASLSTLEEGKPLLVPLVSDNATLAPISKEQFFSFIEADPTEPFVASMEIVRLGMMNTGETTAPFVILSVPDPQIASKEFLIAEPTLLQLFYRALGIDLTAHVAEMGKEFEGTYLYNLPVRMLRSTNAITGELEPVLLYGYATNNIIVVTTAPEILKSVYDTIIRQR